MAAVNTGRCNNVVFRGTPKKDLPEYWNGDIPWISANSMHSTRLGSSDLKITEAGLESGSRLAEKDSILLLVRGGALHNRIPVGIATRDVAFNQDVKALKAKTELISPWYLLFWLMAHERFLLASVVEYTGIGAGKLDTKRMQGLPFLVPPPNEREAIENLARALDDRIELLRETNATLEAVAQALFKSWFVDFDPVHARARGEQPAGLAPEVAALFPDSFEESELGMVPKGWKIGTLASVANFQNGYAFKSKDWRETGHPVVKIGDVKPGIIDFSGCSYIDPETTEGLSRFKLERGDLLVGMTGYVGETGLVPHVKPHAYLNQRVGRIATRSGLADLGFVYCLVRNPAFKRYAEAHSHGSAQANVSGAVLLDYATFIPTKDLLNHFNGVVGEMLESILSNHEQAQTLATLRDTLLPRLISGQLRLPEAEAQLSEAGLCQ
ncbi:restriction endonuclease subunit S [Aeromonas caviae]|uniref:restriction endonuclease subunit S n=1 Tax=Aeromonas caviae TaxID=648 RepID=UPI003EC4B801